MADRRRLVKLVRDRIGQFIAADGRASYESVGRTTHLKLLRKKLIEEALEYHETPSLGELADVLEAVRCLCALDVGSTWTELITEMEAKKSERGGFEEGTAMFIVSTAPSRHEGEQP